MAKARNACIDPGHHVHDADDFVIAVERNTKVLEPMVRESNE